MKTSPGDSREIAMAMNGHRGRAMARPTDAPTRSRSRFARRTERRTAIPYNETEKLRSRGSQNGMMPGSFPIRLTMLGRVQHRDIVLRAVSAACKLVREQPSPTSRAGQTSQGSDGSQVSEVSEQG